MTGDGHHFPGTNSTTYRWLDVIGFHFTCVVLIHGIKSQTSYILTLNKTVKPIFAYGIQ